MSLHQFRFCYIACLGFIAMGIAVKPESGPVFSAAALVCGLVYCAARYIAQAVAPPSGQGEGE